MNVRVRTRNPAAPAPVIQPDRLEHVPLEDLRLVGRQTRVHGVAQSAALDKSVRRFGFVNPVVINAEGEVICGRARVEAARRLKMTSVPCIRLHHLNAEEIRLLRISDNRIAELAGWDKEALKAEFDALSMEVPELDLSVSGFSIPEIEAIRFDGASEDDRETLVPLHPERPVSRPGDLWRLDGHTVLCGDSREAESYERVCGGESCQAVFTDAPYNVSVSQTVTSDPRHGEFVAGSGEMTTEAFQAFLNSVYALAYAWLIAGGVAFTAMDWRSLQVSYAAAIEAGFKLLNLCVWDKGRGGMGSFYRSQHELFHVWAKPGAPHRNTVQLGRNGRNRTNVWRYEGMAGNTADKRRLRELHPTVKPVALIADALLDCTAPGDRVLDPFGGSGSTLIACENIGRTARLIELDPKYVDVIVARWQAYTGREATLDGSGLTFHQAGVQRGREG